MGVLLAYLTVYHLHVVPLKDKRECHILWDWRYRHLSDIVGPDPLEEQPLFLTAEPAF